ncbi:hypothetical protein [Archangium sp.]|uniref:hypothetical protein n=1 Tax=Archangium sp. TaxID=1872627 RepID=UPI00286A1583|nr:hypothetical protein [Archangium sp.]
MSTYQYYEFLAVDRALTSAEQGALRKLSTRADITSSRFVNVYNYGDFKGEPDRLMERYFDVFVYVASWGTRELQLRLPRRLFDPAQAQPYLHEESLSVRTKGDHVLLKFRVDRDDEPDWEEGEGWLASLLPLRAELLAGDLRALYIGWLAGGPGPEEDEDDFDSGDEDGEADEAVEPPVPPGLGESSPALKALADFLFVPRSMVRAAAKASPARASDAVPKRALADWLSSLPAKDKDALLLRVIQGPEPLLGAELLRRFRESRPREPSASSADARRTAGELRAEAAVLETEHSRRQAKQEARARARELETLSAREEEVWLEVESLFATRSSSDHARGVALLVDLRDLAQHRGTLVDFQRRFTDLWERNVRRQGLMRRMNEAGLGTQV